jgi:hypothetical protein
LAAGRHEPRRGAGADATGQPCSLDREIGLVWTEHDDVTIQVVVDASLDAVDPNGVDLLRRFAEHLRAR